MKGESQVTRLGVKLDETRSYGGSVKQAKAQERLLREQGVMPKKASRGGIAHA